MKSRFDRLVLMAALPLLICLNIAAAPAQRREHRLNRGLDPTT